MTDTIADQIHEYESQLADVEELLKASPTDESLLSLQSDLNELLAMTRQSLKSHENIKFEPNVLEKALEAAVETSVGLTNNSSGAECFEQESQAVLASAGDTIVEPLKKTPKKLKEFQVPEHLIPRENETEAEKNRKRRAIKALKSKHRQEMKQVESQKKQKSWQSFQKKTSKINDKSIFSTSQDDGTKVGVVATMGRQSDRPGDRKRFKSS